MEKLLIEIRMVCGKTYKANTADFDSFIEKLSNHEWVHIENHKHAIQTDKVTSCEVIGTTYIPE